ncbi:MAG: hypothetical protein U1E70_24715 [Acetobacteraceae bacterium]|nr:hypothetical protein [Pseudomonadota bacterium]
MGLTDGVYQFASTDDVLTISGAYLRLDEERLRIERRLTALPERAPARDEAWQELEVILKQLAGLLAKLAALPSLSAEQMKAKAEVLGRALRPAIADPSVATADMLKLARALAHEVATSPGLPVAAQEQRGKQLRQAEN